MMLAAALRELMAAGLTGEGLISALERIEASSMPEKPRSKHAEAQARYAAKQRSALISMDDHSDQPDHSDAAPPSQVSPSSSPSTPTPITTPSSPSPSSLRSDSLESDFPEDYRQQFWTLYPRKVGKKAAVRRVELVHRSREISWSEFVAAIGRIDTKDPKFIPHPATWLTQGRYLDQIGSSPPAEVPKFAPPPGMKSLEETLQEYRNGASGTSIRRGASLDKNGADNHSELPLSSGGSLQKQDGGTEWGAPDDPARH